jgi:hypothetical protein
VRAARSAISSRQKEGSFYLGWPGQLPADAQPCGRLRRELLLEFIHQTCGLALAGTIGTWLEESLAG